jgi:RNA polymerase sigma-70 factor (ECF subfamily)
MVNYSTLDDVMLISLIVQSHSDALSELYDRYSCLVFSLALRLVGDRSTAEEITLDVFTRVWQRADMYRPEKARVNTWLTGITRYRAIDMLRRQRAHGIVSTVNWAEVDPGAVSHVNDPEEAAELALQRQRIRLAMAELPSDQREALTLAYFRGYTHREIAEALDEPLGTVKTRIRLAMQKLRQILQGEVVA